MNLKPLFLSPSSMLVDGLPMDHPYVVTFHQELLHLVKAKLVDIVQRPGCQGYFLEFTKEGLEWNKETLQTQQRLLQIEQRVLEQKGAVPTEDTPTPVVHNLPPGTVRFRELKPGAKFRIVVGKGPHKLRYKKVSDAEEDNAVTDAETPEPCSFPEDQPVIPASKGTV